MFSRLRRTRIVTRLAGALQSRAFRATVTLVVAVGLACWVWSPAFEDLYATGYSDWQMVHHNWEAGFIALARYGEWPLWDPFHCGGVTILGNPESQHFSPLFFLSFLIGTVPAVKVFLVAHAAAGLLGMYLLARRRFALRPSAAWLASIAWAASGFFAWHGSGGHATFLPFFFVPWVLLAFHRSLTHPRAIVALSLILILTIFEGGTYPFPYLLLLLTLEASIALATGTRLGTVLRTGIGTGLLTGLGAGVRLVPIMETLKRLPRQVASGDQLNLTEVLAMLTEHEHDYRWGHEYVWAEYGTYVGWGVVILAIAGAVAVRNRHKVPLVVATLVFLALTMGSASALHPWPVLHSLPLFDSLRVPSRFAVLFAFHLALLGGLGLHGLGCALDSLRLRPIFDWLRRLLPVTFALGLGFLVVDGNWDVVDRFDWAPIDSSPPAPRYHLVAADNYPRLYASLPRQNLGTPRCYDGGMNWTVATTLWLGDEPQARITGGPGEVLEWSRTTSTVSAKVRLEQPGRVVFNQNYFPDWQSDQGRVVDDAGRLAVEVPGGEHLVVATYQPPSLVRGGLFSLAGLLLALVWLWIAMPSRLGRIGAFLRWLLGIRWHHGDGDGGGSGRPPAPAPSPEEPAAPGDHPAPAAEEAKAPDDAPNNAIDTKAGP